MSNIKHQSQALMGFDILWEKIIPKYSINIEKKYLYKRRILTKEKIQPQFG